MILNITEFRNSYITPWCAGVIKIVVATPAFDGLSVNTEFVCELAN